MLRDARLQGASHHDHEHNTRGECLASGVFYASTPTGSGGIRFTDHRKHMDGYPIAFPGASYDMVPHAGQLILFPPWQLHAVLPSTYEEHPDADAAASAESSRQLRISWAFNLVTKTAKVSPRTGTNGRAGLMLRDLPDAIAPAVGG